MPLAVGLSYKLAVKNRLGNVINTRTLLRESQVLRVSANRNKGTREFLPWRTEEKGIFKAHCSVPNTPLWLSRLF